MTAPTVYIVEARTTAGDWFHLAGPVPLALARAILAGSGPNARIVSRRPEAEQEAH